MSTSRAKKILQMAIQNQSHVVPNSQDDNNNQHGGSNENCVGQDKLVQVLSTVFEKNKSRNILQNQANYSEIISWNLLDSEEEYEITENVVVDEIFEVERPQCRPSLNDDTSLALPPQGSNQDSSKVSSHLVKLVDYSDSDSEPDEPIVKRKKRCQVKKSEWGSEINRKSREKGKEYYGKRKIDGEWNKSIKKPKRMLKPRCNCEEKKKGALQCHQISDDDRQVVFDKFWNLTWGQKRIYVENTVKVFHTNRQRDRKDPEISRRVNSFIYFLKKGDEMIRVCKLLYLNTRKNLCLGLEDWISRKENHRTRSHQSKF